MDPLHAARTFRAGVAPATGPLTAADARVALFAWLLARQTGGSFVVPVDTPETARAVGEDLAWLGLAPDAGPRVVADRAAYHRERAGVLLAAGTAYERDGGLWFRLPPGRTIVRDLVHGEVSFDHAALGDVALLRADGSATDSFTGAVDDADLAVDLVVREDDQLDRTPGEQALFRALGHEPPRYAHVGRLLEGDAFTVAGLRAAGYLPDALIAHLALHGWSPADGREAFDLTELTALFTLDRLHAAPAHFDEPRLRAFNARALRALPRERYHALLAATMQRYRLLEDPVPEAARRWIDTFLDAFGEQVHTLREAAEEVARLREESVLVPALELERLRNRQVLFFLDAVSQYVDAQPELRDLPLENDIPAIAHEFGIARDDAFAALRVALTGARAGPPLTLLFPLLGHDRIMIRIGAINAHVLHGRGLEPIRYGPGGVPFETIQATQPIDAES